MSKPEKRPALEDVLHTYLLTVDEPDLNSAQEWGRRFPEHAEAIQDFVTSWKLAATLPVDPESCAAESAAFVTLGTAVLASVLRREQEKGHTAISEPPIESLLAEAKARGMMPGDLAAGLRASVPLLAKLNRRLLEPASIPRELTEAVATMLGRTEAAVAIYLARPPTLSQAGFHRAKEKPVVVGREDFFEAVRLDPALSEEHRARWLSLASGRKPSE